MGIDTVCLNIDGKAFPVHIHEYHKTFLNYFTIVNEKFHGAIMLNDGVFLGFDFPVKSLKVGKYDPSAYNLFMRRLPTGEAYILETQPTANSFLLILECGKEAGNILRIYIQGKLESENHTIIVKAHLKGKRPEPQWIVP